MTDARMPAAWLVELATDQLSDGAFRHWIGSVLHCSEHVPTGRFIRRDSRFFSPTVLTQSMVDELVLGSFWAQISETEFQLVKWTPPKRRSAQRLPVPWQIRRAVIMRDGRVCGICKLEVDDADLHIDHIVPVSKGGANDLTNLQVSHSFCNMKKSNRA